MRNKYRDGRKKEPKGYLRLGPFRKAAKGQEKERGKAFIMPRASGKKKSRSLSFDEEP